MFLSTLKRKSRCDLACVYLRTFEILLVFEYEVKEPLTF